MPPHPFAQFIQEEQILLGIYSIDSQSRLQQVLHLLREELRQAHVLVPFGLYGGHAEIQVGIWQIHDDYLVYVELPQENRFVFQLLNNLSLQLQEWLEWLMTLHLRQGYYVFPFCIIEGGRPD